MDGVVELGVILKGIIESGVASKATNLITTVKSSNDKDKVISAYEEVFNQLIEENQQLKSVALAYKEEYDQMNLSEQDINYLQTTAQRLLELFIPEITSEMREKLEEQGLEEDELKKMEQEREEYLKFIDLIQVDTLRTMQHLGYNYKKAIGEPLTELTSQSILSSLRK